MAEVDNHTALHSDLTSAVPSSTAEHDSKRRRYSRVELVNIHNSGPQDARLPGMDLFPAVDIHNDEARRPEAFEGPLLLDGMRRLSLNALNVQKHGRLFQAAHTAAQLATARSLDVSPKKKAGAGFPSTLMAGKAPSTAGRLEAPTAAGRLRSPNKGTTTRAPVACALDGDDDDVPPGFEGVSASASMPGYDADMPLTIKAYRGAAYVLDCGDHDGGDDDDVPPGFGGMPWAQTATAGANAAAGNSHGFGFYDMLDACDVPPGFEQALAAKAHHALGAGC